MLKQPDYLGDVGRIPRLVCVAAVGFFAVLFSLVTFVNAIGIVILAVTGQWDLVPIVGGSVAGTGIFGAGLIWVLRRLVRPRTNPGVVAVFPLWFAEDVWRPTATGQQVTTGASTNDNRAVEMRGWRWVVDGNEYTVHRNVAFDRKHKINDGEGLMHEDHVNSTVLDSVLTNNRGNTYLSVYKTAGVDGLLIEGNDIRLGDGKQAIASGAAIYVNADRNSGRFPCRRVSVLKNTVAGGGILLSGDPSEKNVVKGNKGVGGPLPLTLKAAAETADNDGFELKRG